MKTAPCILVAVDFSEPATAAYREARELAAHADADLRLLHVAEQRDEHEEARRGKWLAEQQVEPAEIITLPGTPWVQIVRYCDATRPLLLVVGSHGAKGYQPLTPGSTTANLLLRSPVPLLVVPRMGARPLPRVDGSGRADQRDPSKLSNLSRNLLGSDDALNSGGSHP